METSAKNIVVLRDNAIISCKMSGVYVEGPGSQPIIVHNVFMVCRAAGVTLNTQVDGFVALNTSSTCTRGIDIINNKSILFGNKIAKSHDDGISVICNSDTDAACPLIQRNFIEACTHNGIVCEGFSCYPIIKANVIDSNRKTGIKLASSARAHIGGEGLNHLAKRTGENNESPIVGNVEDHLKEFETLYTSLFDDALGDSAGSGNMMSFYEVLDAVAELKEQIGQHMSQLSQPMGNFIHQNYCQGILLEEGCSADIFSNHIKGNLKANIALGGQGSTDSKIKKNLIEKSKKEGIFVVEGGESLLIQTNIITDNENGIVLLHSDGIIDSNLISENELSGISVVSETVAKIENN